MKSTKEIKKILLGHTILEDDCFRAAVGGEVLLTLDAPNGWASTRLWGVMHRDRRYRLPEGKDASDVQAVLSTFGRRTVLKDSPGTMAALSKSVLAERVLYVAYIDGDDIFVTVFCGRSITGIFHLARCVRTVERRMRNEFGEAPEKLKIEKPTPKEKRLARREKRLARKRDRLEAKRERKKAAEKEQAIKNGVKLRSSNPLPVVSGSTIVTRADDKTKK